jgi:hypothetical protein
MSPDGRFIVGELSGGGPYLWDTVTGDMTTLPAPGQSAVAVSDDGTVVLGNMTDAGNTVAGIWTAADGWQSIGYLPNATCPPLSSAYELSGDGTVATGLSWDGCDGRGFVWTAATGILELEGLANGTNRASVLSADGTLIGGFAQGSFSRTPCYWDGLTQAGTLLDPPNGDAVGEVFGINDEGSIMLGNWATTEPMARASKWIDGPTGWVREQIGDGSLLPGWQGIPMDIADDGTIVGFDILMTSRRAWIQLDGAGPIFDFKTYIQSLGAQVPGGVILEVCQAISTDGRSIIGHGFFTGGWLVTIGADCPADINGDSFVDVLDLLAVLAAWGNTGGPEDVNGDGIVDVLDLLELLSAWGPCA